MARQEAAAEYRDGLRHTVSDRLAAIHLEDLLIAELRELIVLVEPAQARLNGRPHITRAHTRQMSCRATRYQLQVALKDHFGALQVDRLTLIELVDLAAALNGVAAASLSRQRRRPPIPP